MSMLDSDADFGAIVCAKMGQLLEQQFATRHIVRVSGIIHLLDQGGRHHPDNLQCLCESCNARKASQVDAER